MSGKSKPETRKRYFLAHLKEHMLAVAKYRSKRDSIPFSITVDDIIVPETCPLLGIKLYRGSTSKNDNSPSLDRKVNSIGYIPGNVWVISRKANTMKNDATPEELRSLARAILTFFPE
jgi:hypothetical protein